MKLCFLRTLYYVVVTVSYTTSSASVRYDESDGTVTLCLIGDIPSSQPYTLVLRTDSLGPNPATSESYS